MSQAEHILIVDDDERASGMLAEILTREGFAVQCVASGERALVALDAKCFDAVILDWSMPGMDGREVCRRIRARTDDRAHIGILMFTGQRTEDMDEVDILGLGADDYLRKGRMNRDVFLMRLRAVLQRRAAMAGAMATVRGALMPDSTQPELLFYGPIEMNLDTRAARQAGKAVELTPRQFELLVLLVKNAGQVVPHERLIDALDENPPNAPEDSREMLEWKIACIRTIDNEMGFIREALGDVDKKRVVAVRGMGYFLARGKND